MSDNKFDTVYVESITSISTVIGSVTGAVSKFIQGIFPSNYFRHISLASNLKSVAARIEKNNNLRMARKQNPALSVLVNYNSNPINMEGFTAVANNISFKLGTIVGTDQDLVRVIDTNSTSELKFSHRRIALDFTIGIRVGNRLEAWNVLERIITGYFAGNSRYYINDVPLQVPLPTVLMNNIIKINNLSDATTDEKLSFLRKYSDFDIDYVLHASTNSHRYVLNLKTNLLMTQGSPASVDIGSNRKSENNSLIQLSFNVAFNFPNNFLLKTLSHADAWSSEVDTSDFILTLWHDIGKSAPREFIDGKKQLLLQPFVCEMNVPLEIIKYDSLLPTFVTDMTSYFQSINVPMSEYLLIKIFIEDFMLTDQEYFIDWDTYQILLENPVMNKNYYIGIYLDMEYVYKYQNSQIQPV